MGNGLRNEEIKMSKSCEEKEDPLKIFSLFQPVCYFFIIPRTTPKSPPELPGRLIFTKFF